MRYRVTFCERVTYEVEFESDTPLSEMQPDDPDGIWFQEMDARVNDWVTAGSVSVEDRQVIALEER